MFFMDAPQKNPGKVLGIIAMILGIFGLVPICGGLSAIVGIILGVLGKKKSSEAGMPSGMAKAGIICGAVGLGVGLISTISCFVCFGGLAFLDSF
jgi:hypothetical protein